MDSNWSSEIGGVATHLKPTGFRTVRMPLVKKRPLWLRRRISFSWSGFINYYYGQPAVLTTTWLRLAGITARAIFTAPVVVSLQVPVNSVCSCLFPSVFDRTRTEATASQVRPGQLDSFKALPIRRDFEFLILWIPFPSVKARFCIATQNP